MPVLEVFADVECVFAHASLRRIAARRAELGRTDVLVHVRAWPLELVNDAPFDPAHVAARVRALRASVAPDLFVAFDPSTFPRSTLPAMDLAAAAYAVDVATGERMSYAIRTSLWEEGQDVSDPEVLAELARRHDVPTDAGADRGRVLADYEEGRERGVEGSPEYFVRGRRWFCPMLEITEAGGGIAVAVDERAAAEFLAACFAS